MDRISYLCGLGNPGSNYANTRHNLGFDLLDTLAGNFGSEWKSCRQKAKVSTAVIGGRDITLFKPLTYVNLTSESFSLFKNLKPSNLLVLCDDMNLDLGNIRIRRSGSSGGHNGLESVENYFGTTEYPRLRMGIGPPPDPGRWKDFVLGPFSGRERKLAEEMLRDAAEAVKTILESGIAEGMQRFNSRNS